MSFTGLRLLIISTVSLTACANAEGGCLQDDPTCFTHAQGDNGGQTGSSAAQQGSGTSTTTGSSNTTVSNANSTTGNANTTSVITQTLVVDDFSSISTFNASENSLLQYQSDDQTMSVYAMVSNNRMELECGSSSSCYWYTMLAAQGACLDLTPYTHIALTIQGAQGGSAMLQLQNNAADCNSTTFAGLQSVDLASYAAFDGNSHSILIPLKAFPNVDQVHGRAIALGSLTSNSPIYVSNIDLVTVTQSN